MATTRADSFTALKRKQEYFSDFLDSFAKSPVGNQLGRVTNEQAVTQSIKNLIKTNIGERLFQPNIGSNIYASLFEHLTEPMIHSLEYYIENTIRNNEPRANLISLEVLSALNDYIEENTLQINIVYNLINNPDPITINFILKKIR